MLSTWTNHDIQVPNAICIFLGWSASALEGIWRPSRLGNSHLNLRRVPESAGGEETDTATDSHHNHQTKPPAATFPPLGSLLGGSDIPQQLAAGHLLFPDMADTLFFWT